MRDFILAFEDFAEGLCWYVVEAVGFLNEEGIALFFVVASFIEDFIIFFFSHFRALLSFA